MDPAGRLTNWVVAAVLAMSEMKAQSPKLVALSRLRTVTHRADFEQWVQEDYDRLELFKYERVFIRKQ